MKKSNIGHCDDALFNYPYTPLGLNALEFLQTKFDNNKIDADCIENETDQVIYENMCRECDSVLSKNNSQYRFELSMNQIENYNLTPLFKNNEEIIVNVPPLFLNKYIETRYFLNYTTSPFIWLIKKFKLENWLHRNFKPTLIRFKAILVLDKFLSDWRNLNYASDITQELFDEITNSKNSRDNLKKEAEEWVEEAKNEAQLFGFENMNVVKLLLLRVSNFMPRI